MSGCRQGFESRRPVQDGAEGKAGADRIARTAAPQRSKHLMISKFRVVAIAAAVFTFAGAGLVGSPALAWQGPIALPSFSYLDHGAAAPLVRTMNVGNHASASLVAFTVRVNDPATTALEARISRLDTEAAAAPTDPLSLDALVANEATGEAHDAEQECLANAVYFEARGEPLQGQLAVAEVVMNRAASGRFPASLCGVVVQRSQFSFVRRGRMPRADRASEAWHRAVGIARIAVSRMAPRLLPANCLWYHANYVSPSWGRRLAQSARIGLHIFYS
jgi:spore germination cell wall hydrolase CwlJ-like protein